MPISSEAVLDLFRRTGALLEGHFVYASGRHGDRFIQAARVLQFPDHTERFCTAMAERFEGDAVELVVGPATGGIILAYETARRLRCRAAFTEKDNGNGMTLRRGFSLPAGTRVLVVEDVITTGGAVRQTMGHLRERGADVVGVSVLVDRSGGTANFDCRFDPLASITLQSWSPKDCPLCGTGEPYVDPDDLVV